MATDRPPPVPHLETLQAPSLYSAAQIRYAVTVCLALHRAYQRGRFILATKPEGNDAAR